MIYLHNTFTLINSSEMLLVYSLEDTFPSIDEGKKSSEEISFSLLNIMVNLFKDKNKKITPHKKAYKL